MFDPGPDRHYLELFITIYRCHGNTEGKDPSCQLVLGEIESTRAVFILWERKSNGLPALEDDSSAAMKRGVSLSLSLVDCLGAISAWFPDDGANAFDPSIEF